MPTAEDYRRKAREELIQFIKELRERQREARRRRRRPPAPRRREPERLPKLAEGIEGVKVIVKEVHKIPLKGNEHWVAGVQIIDGTWISPVFNIDYRDAHEFYRKLRLEIKRYLYQKRVLGVEVARRR